MQGGLHAAHTIVRRLRGDDRTTPVPLPRRRQCRNDRPLQRDLQLRQASARTAYRRGSCGSFVHLAFLNGFANRFFTLLAWVRSMVGRARPSGCSASVTPAVTSAHRTRCGRGSRRTCSRPIRPRARILLRLRSPRRSRRTSPRWSSTYSMISDGMTSTAATPNTTSTVPSVADGAAAWSTVSVSGQHVRPLGHTPRADDGRDRARWRRTARTWWASRSNRMSDAIPAQRGDDHERRARAT